MEIKLLWLLHFLEFAGFSAVTARKESQHYKSEETKIFLFLQKFGTIFSWFSMIRSLGFSLHLMDSSLSWFLLVSCLLCTESIFFFFYCNDFFPVCLFIYYLGVCQIIILSLSWLPIQVSFISRSVLLWRILSFLHSFFFPCAHPGPSCWLHLYYTFCLL